MKKEFASCFQISKMVIFEVGYYTLGSNGSPYFATSASRFVRNKKDYDLCGQCQGELLPEGSLARDFWEKWHSFHLHGLTEGELDELWRDVEKLGEAYNYEIGTSDRFGTHGDGNARIPFHKIVEMSKQTPKKPVEGVEIEPFSKENDLEER